VPIESGPERDAKTNDRGTVNCYVRLEALSAGGFAGWGANAGATRELGLWPSSTRDQGTRAGTPGTRKRAWSPITRAASPAPVAVADPSMGDGEEGYTANAISGFESHDGLASG
jgi:hypothetical protein